MAKKAKVLENAYGAKWRGLTIGPRPGVSEATSGPATSRVALQVRWWTVAEGPFN
jgi:hypothetical protein